MTPKTNIRFLICLVVLSLLLVGCGSINQSENDELPLESQAQSSEGESTSNQIAQQPSPVDAVSASPAGTSRAFAATAPAGMGGAPSSALSFNPPVQQQAIVPTPADMQFENPGTNPFYDTEDDNLSTFAMDVDTGSYTVARSYLVGQNQLPPEDAIRPEEFVNYFDADYDSPSGDDAFAIYLDAAPAPFGYEDHYALRVGIQARYIAPEDRDPVTLIFVIDVSGSMDMENRLGLVKESLALLLDGLREDDRVGIVVYSDVSRSLLDPTPASERETIMSVIDALHPEGSTNAEDGLRIGYQLAQDTLIDGQNTRIILCSDGVANVGNTGPDAILQTIREGVDDGITLSAIGFGMGNYNDALMEQLSNDGNGNYYYVDNLREARRVFVNNITGTLQVVGYDAKVQVDFNPEVTDRYRLIGYENRAIADQDFRNDTVDAGEVGAGHSVTALYEIALEAGAAQPNADSVIATVFIRYEDAETREVVEISRPLTVGDLRESMDDAPATFRVQAAVAEFAELLRGSTWAEEGSYGAVLNLLESAQANLPENNDALASSVDELITLVQAVIRLGDQ